MIVLSTETVRPFEAVWAILIVFSLFGGTLCTLFSEFEGALFGGKVALIIIILSIIGAGIWNPVCTQRKIMLSDMTYQELIVNYEVLDSEGLILTIKDKH